MIVYGPVPTTRRTGREPFHRGGRPTGVCLGDFWQWSASDLLGNTARGILAEYIVALDLGIAGGVWSGWGTWDLETPDGIKVEVKSASYLQAWGQRELSKITFGIAPTRPWDPESNRYADQVKRWSDAYVFSVLANKDPATLDPLDLEQWTFYVLGTSALDEKCPRQKRIGLAGLLRLGPLEVRFGEIGRAVGNVGRHQLG